MQQLIQDVRHGLRVMRRAPGFTLAAVLALALGIGSTTAIFTVLDRVVLRPLPYADPDRLVMIWEANRPKALLHEPVSPVNFVDYRSLQAFADAAAWWRPTVNLTSGEGEPVRVSTVEASSNLFTVLGVRPLLGAGFPGEPLHGSAQEAVISYRLWRSRFRGRSDMVGQLIEMNGEGYTVLGVMPPGFQFPGDTDVWWRLSWDLAQHSRGAHFMEAVARLRPGATVQEARAELDTVTARLEREAPSTNAGWGARAILLHQEVAGFFRPALFVLMGAVALLLLIACINVANLLLARATARTREVALRAALGASRRRLVGQFLAESALLALAGSGLGLVLGALAVAAFVESAPVEVPGLAGTRLDLRVLGFVSLLAGLTTVVFGLVPALLASRPDLRHSLQEGGGGVVTARTGRRTRSILVMAEVGLAAMLLAGSGLLIRSFMAMSRQDPGFVTDGVLTANLELSGAAHGDWPSVERFYSRLMESLRRHPRVQAAGASNFLPLEAGWRVPFQIIGQPAPPPGEEATVQHHTVDDGYFKTLGVPLLAGRGFEERDTQDAPGVIVINASLARKYWPGQDPVGQRILSYAHVIGPLGRRLVEKPEHEVIGVVGDFKNAGLLAETEPAIYHTQRQFPFRNVHLMLRGSEGPAALAAVLREEVRRADSALPVDRIRSLAQAVGESTEKPRLLMLLMTGFGLLALVLAAVGIYGILAYAVAQRRREIGVRMALGASRRKVLWLVVREGLLLSGVGAALGLAGAALGGRSLRSLLYGVTALDPMTYALVAAVVMMVALLACLNPARRAAGVDPLTSLRAD